MSKKKRVAGFNRDTGKFWGLICLVPFGGIFFLASIIRRKNDVIKYKSLEAGAALDILHNYIQSFISACIFVAVLCLMSYISDSGYYLLPSFSYIVFIVVISIVYNIVTDKILSFEEKRQSGKQDDAPIKSKVKKNNNDNESNDMKKRLEELKEQNRKQTDTIRKLEKEIKKRRK